MPAGPCSQWTHSTSGQLMAAASTVCSSGRCRVTYNTSTLVTWPPLYTVLNMLQWLQTTCRRPLAWCRCVVCVSHLQPSTQQWPHTHHSGLINPSSAHPPISGLVLSVSGPSIMPSSAQPAYSAGCRAPMLKSARCSGRCGLYGPCTFPPTSSRLLLGNTSMCVHTVPSWVAGRVGVCSGLLATLCLSNNCAVLLLDQQFSSGEVAGRCSAVGPLPLL